MATLAVKRMRRTVLFFGAAFSDLTTSRAIMDLTAARFAAESHN
jgi:hypothetical protein